MGQNAVEAPAGKSLYDYVVYDSSIEKAFAKDLALADDVEVFAKLPPAFTIDTPLGTYNPDWAFVQREGGKDIVYFVVETKGGGNGTPALRAHEKEKVDCARMHFKATGADVRYEVKTTLRG